MYLWIRLPGTHPSYCLAPDAIPAKWHTAKVIPMLILRESWTRNVTVDTERYKWIITTVFALIFYQYALCFCPQGRLACTSDNRTLNESKICTLSVKTGVKWWHGTLHLAMARNVTFLFKRAWDRHPSMVWLRIFFVGYTFRSVMLYKRIGIDVTAGSQATKKKVVWTYAWTLPKLNLSYCFYQNLFRIWPRKLHHPVINVKLMSKAAKPTPRRPVVARWRHETKKWRSVFETRWTYFEEQYLNLERRETIQFFLSGLGGSKERHCLKTLSLQPTWKRRKKL